MDNRGIWVMVRFKRWPWWKRLFRNHRKPLINHVTYGGVAMLEHQSGTYYIKQDES